MTTQYEPLGSSRFSVEQTTSGEQIRVRPPRSIFTVLFIAFWLCAWTVGGIAAMRGVFHSFHPFLLFWLGGWALAWIAAGTQLLWMTVGSEILRAEHGDLEITQQIFGFSRRKNYRGGDIRHLIAVNQSTWSSWNQNTFAFGRSGQTGSIKFDYGTRTIYAASGLDEAEAKSLVDRLRKRLPPGAADVSVRQ